MHFVTALIIATGILKNESGLEGGGAWRNLPSKKALKLSGAQSAEVIISFSTNASFEPDPAFGKGNIHPSIATAMPVRIVFPGDIRIYNIMLLSVL